MSIIQAEMYFLAVIGLLTTVVSAFYYLRIIKIAYFDEPKESFEIEKNYGLKVSLFLSTFIILLYFIYPSILLELISNIEII